MDLKLQALITANADQFFKQMGAVEAKTDGLDKDTRLSMKATTQMWRGIGNGMVSLGKKMSLAITAPLIAIGKESIETGIKFDEQMKRAGAILGATGDEYARLESQAKKLGATTVFTAAQVAEAQGQLAMAGFKANDVLGAMPGVVNLAAISGGDMALAADAVAASLNQFSLEGADATRVADVFAKAATSSNTDTRLLAESMKYAGPTAASLGLSLEETAAAIGFLGNAGIQGSQAGTTLQGALVRLSKPSKDAAVLMEELGFSAFDAQGNMLPMPALVGELQRATEGMTREQKAQTFATLFGQRAMSGMLELVKAGPEELGAFTQSLEASSGTADTMAKEMMSGLFGSFKKLESAIDGAKKAISDAMNVVLVPLIDKVTAIITKFNELDAASQQRIVKIGALVAAAGPLLIIGGAIINRITGMINNFTLLGETLGLAKGLISGTVGALKAFAGPIAIIGALAAAFKTAYDHSESFRNAIHSTVQGVAQAFGEMSAKVGGALQRIGQALAPVFEALKSLWVHVSTALAPVFEFLAKILGGVLSGAFKVIGALAQGLAKVFEFLSPFVTDVLKLFEGLADLIGAFLTPAFEVLGRIVDAVGGILGGLWARMGDFANAVMDTLGPVIKIIGEIVKTVGGFLGKVGEGVGWVAKKLGLAKDEAATNTQEMSNQTQTDMESIANTASSCMSNVTDTVINGTKKASDGSKVNLSQMGMDSKTLFQSMNQTAGSETEQMASRVQENLYRANAGGSQAVNKLQANTQNSMNSLNRHANASTYQTGQSVSRNLGLASTAGTGAMLSLEGGVSRSMAGLASGVDHKMIQTEASIVGKLNSAKAQSIASGNGMAGAVVGSMQTLANGTGGQMNRFQQAVSGAMGGASGAIRSGLSRALSTARSLAGGFIGIGRNIAKGLSRGISNGIGWVTSAARRIAGRAVRAAKSALGIHSPSRVMRKEVGPKVPQGLGAGILDNARYVTRAMDEMVNRAIDAPSIDVAVDGLMNPTANLGPARIQTVGDLRKPAQPMTLILDLGGRTFRAFVDDITEAQDQRVKLELGYLGV